MLFPVIETGTFVALSTLFPCMQQTRQRPALARVVQEQREAVAHLWERHRRGPCFSPEGLPSRSTPWRSTQACDEEASPSHGVPPHPPSRRHSCCAAGMLQGEVRPGPPGHMGPARSRPLHGRGQSRRAPPPAGRDPASAPPRPLLMAFLPLRRARHHRALDHLDDPWALGAIAPGAWRPGVLGQRGAPRVEAVPGTRRATPPTARLRRGGPQVAPHRVPRHRQPRALAHVLEPATQPIRTPPLVSASHPPRREPRAPGLQPVQRHRVPRARPGQFAQFAQ